MTKANNTKAIADKAEAAAAARIAKALAKAVTPTASDTLESLRVAVADKATSDYGATGRYAALLTSTYGAGWQDADLTGKAESDTNSQAAIRAERTSLYDVLKAKGHPNCSVVWARIKKHAVDTGKAMTKAAEKEALAKMTPEEKAEAVKEAALAKVTSLRDRLLDQLTALQAAMAKVDGLADDMFQAKGHIEKAIRAVNPTYVVPKVASK